MLKNIVITAGGTSEKIDGVRKITNMSTGKLGATICNNILSEIEKEVKNIYYLCSSSSVKPKENEKIIVINITGAYDLKEKVESLLENVKVDYFIHSMAVSDYTTDYVSNIKMLSDEIIDKVFDCKDNITKKELNFLINQILSSPEGKISREKKMSSKESDMFVKLKSTPKVISIIKKMQPDLKLIGFKLLSNVEEDELIQVGSNLMQKNNCDYVVANDLAKIKKGNHEAIILDSSGKKIKITGKDAIAQKITDIIKN